VLIKWIQKHSLRRKMMSAFCSFLLLVLIIFAVFYWGSLRNIQLENINHMIQLNMQLNATLDAILVSPEQLKYIQLYDNKYRGILRHNEAALPPAGQYENTQYIENAIKHTAFSNPYVIRATIFSHDKTYSSVNSGISDYQNKIQKIVDGITWDSVTKTIYTEVFDTDIELNRYRILTMICYLHEYDTKVPLGILAVDIDFRKICDAFERSAEQANGSGIAVFSESGLVYQSAKSPLSLENQPELQETLRKGAEVLLKEGGKSREIKVGKERYCLTATLNEKTGWDIIQYQSEAVLFDSSTQDLQKSLLLITGLFFIFLGISYVLAATVSRPLELINSAITANRESQLAPIPLDKPMADNDMGRVIQNYNEMVERINKSIRNEINYEVTKQKMQIRMLRYQINPHFLYNTLNIISSIAQIEGVDSICQVSGSLSRIMRYNVQGSDIVQVSQELQNARDYLSIQTTRFPEIFTTAFFVQEGVESLAMPKFLLQPILENAISHGLKKTRSGGEIGVDVYTETDQLRITVWDNGGRIDSDEAERWNQILKTDTASNMMDEVADNEWESIGLRNVNARIKGYYGNAYGLFIEAAAGGITKIHLRLHIEDLE